MHTTEDRLAALIASGISVSFDLNTSEDQARIRFSFRQGETVYPGCRGRGFNVSDEGEGREGIARFRAGLAAAEAFVGMSLPIHLPPEFGIKNGATADVMTPSDPLRTAHRTGNRALAEQHDERACELVDADQGLGR